jgi:hypothetical protein
MEERLISFEIAKLAKEKGFKEEVYAYYYIKSEKENELNYVISDYDPNEYKDILCDYNSLDAFYFDTKNYVSASTQGLLQKWLRDVYNTIINLSAIPDHRDIDNKKLSFYYDILKDNDWIEEELDEKNSDPVYYATYEEALESGLEAALNLITKK